MAKYCTSCKCEMGLRDSKGKVFHTKNFNQMYLNFKGGIKMKVLVCKECVDNKSHSEILNSTLESESKINFAIKDFLKDKTLIGLEK